MTVLLDTHTLLWWALEPDRIGPDATRLLTEADELAAAAVSWYELAWLIRTGRIRSTVPTRSLISILARDVRTMTLTPSIAVTAVELPDSFPRDPTDRQIYATAVEHGWKLLTRDQRMRAHDVDGSVVVW